MKRETKYEVIGKQFEEQILTGVLQVGQKLPSVRKLTAEFDISVNTASNIFWWLEKKGLIYSKPQSGYFVSNIPAFKQELPAITDPLLKPSNLSADELTAKVMHTINAKNIVRLSIGLPDESYLPIAALKKGLNKHLTSLDYNSLQGAELLRKAIAQYTYTWGGKVKPNHIISAHGAIGALALALKTVTKPGDIIALESPCYFGLLQLAQSFGLKVIELPSHPTQGVELKSLEKIMPKIATAIFIANFNNPMGSLIPDENKQKIVELFHEHGKPVIEDDLYGDLYFSGSRPRPLKYFDKNATVIWCGGFSKTLAPGFRVGWIVNEQYFEQILKIKYSDQIATVGLGENAIGEFILSGKYEKHLKQLRMHFQNNYHQLVEAIYKHFPEGTKLSQPQGGISLWVSLPEHINTGHLFEKALKQKIAFTPGRIFSLQHQYENCMRFNLGLEFDSTVEKAIRTIGNLI
ncbi:aminotransferase-like domain-containing protein [Gynurincola endophyticus]|uniref:aminotransferase-like domain-containing protein n=1 Tax=Gynurincola endophyticus TaxID=2479004 RepID=UPI000F8E9873|nr:PLP-dependent aminotransferase family protein [Gynurincola endophyticus]